MTEVNSEDHDDLVPVSVDEFPSGDDIDSTTVVDDGEPENGDNELDDDYNDPNLTPVSETNEDGLI